MTATPRTDREKYRVSKADIGFEVVGVKLAEELEAEIAVLKAVRGRPIAEPVATTDMHTTVTSATAVHYSPLVLEYTAPGCARHWHLDFRSLPEPRIFFHGDEPTTDELVECLRNVTAPVWFIDICKVVIGHLRKDAPSVTDDCPF